MADEHLNWVPRTPSWKRLAADPMDWSAFSVGDQVGVFVGNCWRKGSIRAIYTDCVSVKAKHLGEQSSSIFNVYDARNICPARDLSRPEKENLPTFFDEVAP